MTVVISTTRSNTHTHGVRHTCAVNYTDDEVKVESFRALEIVTTAS